MNIDKSACPTVTTADVGPKTSFPACPLTVFVYTPPELGTVTVYTKEILDDAEILYDTFVSGNGIPCHISVPVVP